MRVPAFTVRIVTYAWLALAAVVAARGEPPRLDVLQPASVAPNRALTLTLVGEGFEAGARVLIETASRGRYVPHRPASVEPGQCRVELPLGFGPNPAERRVMLENPDGGRTEALVLAIVAMPDAGPGGSMEDVPTPVEVAGSQTLAAGGSDPIGIGDEEPGRPVIRQLLPPEVVAGRPLVLQVHGESFTPESEVWVAANVHAGSSRLPEYELKSFPTHFVDDELLEVEFDRGFYPVPGARDVVVQGASGARSTPALLRIRMEEER